MHRHSAVGQYDKRPNACSVKVEKTWTVIFTAAVASSMDRFPAREFAGKYCPRRVVVAMEAGMEEGTCGGTWDKRSEKTATPVCSEYGSHVCTSPALLSLPPPQTPTSKWRTPPPPPPASPSSPPSRTAPAPPPGTKLPPHCSSAELEPILAGSAEDDCYRRCLVGCCCCRSRRRGGSSGWRR